MVNSSTLGVFYFVGSLMSLLASTFVIFTYLKFKELQKHPSSLILWRSVYDFCFSFQFIVLFFYDTGKDHCSVFAFFVEFFLLGSQSWYFMVAIDLLTALRNPFTDPKANLKLYHVYVHTTSLLAGLLLVGGDQTDYRTGLQICWVKGTDNAGAANAYTWVLFFVPTLIYYVFSIGVIAMAAYRLKKGLQSTFQIRYKILYNGVRYVLAFAVYWTIAAIIYFNIYEYERETTSIDPQDHVSLYGAFAVTIGIRGFIDVGVWMYNQSVVAAYRRWWRREPAPEDHFKDINTALRKEVLLYSTLGICTAIDTAAKPPLSEHLPRDSAYVKFLGDPAGVEAQEHLCLRREDSELEEVPFIDYCPQVFRFLRARWSITDESFKRSIRGKTEAMLERFTDGRSGSFFYFSEDSKYIVKTLTASEAKLMFRFLPAYTQYMTNNPDSLVCKFVGFHSIRLYNLTLYFVVMLSVFLTHLPIHEKYDLKGSWIDRHTSDPKGIKKDSDLHRRLLLSEAKRERFVAQLTADARFLQSCNIMDYSLLLGIHYMQHVVGMRASTGTVAVAAADYKQGAAADQTAGAAGTVAANGSRGSLVPFFQEESGGVRARVIEGPGIYFFGLIDILQEWNTNKKCERWLKTYLRCKPAAGISAVPPDQYADRFVRKMQEITNMDEFGYKEGRPTTLSVDHGSGSGSGSAGSPAATVAAVPSADAKGDSPQRASGTVVAGSTPVPVGYDPALKMQDMGESGAAKIEMSPPREAESLAGRTHPSASTAARDSASAPGAATPMSAAASALVAADSTTLPESVAVTVNGDVSGESAPPPPTDAADS